MENMDKFYQVLSPRDYNFAYFGLHGTWKGNSEAPGLCPECTRSMQARVPPLIMEWEPGSERIGDFSWRGISFEIVSRLDIAKSLKQYFTGFSIESIEMVMNSNRGTSKGKKKCVSLPYDGPELCEIWVNNFLRLDDSASALQIERICRTCNFKYYKPKREGLVLEPDLESTGFFRVEQFPGWVFCSTEVKNYIEGQKFTNISFLNMN
jgi:hypothetical protein